MKPAAFSGTPAIRHNSATACADRVTARRASSTSSAAALSLRFTVPAESVQGNEVVGGGAVSTVLDLAMALAVLSKIEPGATCSTLSLTVNFLSPLREADVTVESRVDRVGKRAAFASATASDTAGRIVATATASLLVH